MEQNKRLAFTFRAALVGTVLLGVFWLIWYAVAGEVPHPAVPDVISHDGIKLSRFWDVAALPLWIYLAARCVLSDGFHEVNENMQDSIGVAQILMCCFEFVAIVVGTISHLADPVKTPMVAVMAAWLLPSMLLSILLGVNNAVGAFKHHYSAWSGLVTTITPGAFMGLLATVAFGVGHGGLAFLIIAASGLWLFAPIYGVSASIRWVFSALD